jgi:hypothetical protein
MAQRIGEYTTHAKNLTARRRCARVCEIDFQKGTMPGLHRCKAVALALLQGLCSWRCSGSLVAAGSTTCPD